MAVGSLNTWDRLPPLPRPLPVPKKLLPIRAPKPSPLAALARKRAR